MAGPKVHPMVLLRFKPGASSEAIESIARALAELPRKISGIEHFSFGPYSSPEGLNKGFSHGFLMVFSDVEARNNYLPHPEHQAVVRLVLPLLDDVMAFDYEV